MGAAPRLAQPPRLRSVLQCCFMMPQSLGVIGGKPNSAHYFIGYVGEWRFYGHALVSQKLGDRVSS